jgi:hypothetical protein
LRLSLRLDEECHAAVSTHDQRKVSFAASAFITQRLACVAGWTTE